MTIKQVWKRERRNKNVKLQVLPLRDARSLSLLNYLRIKHSRKNKISLHVLNKHFAVLERVPIFSTVATEWRKGSKFNTVFSMLSTSSECGGGWWQQLASKLFFMSQHIIWSSISKRIWLNSFIYNGSKSDLLTPAAAKV